MVDERWFALIKDSGDQFADVVEYRTFGPVHSPSFARINAFRHHSAASAYSPTAMQNNMIEIPAACQVVR
ncbi:Uncharacterised protein [Mycobacteroides abscessus subsp. massiliense]|nr:Uncharacterised protein [Mycobacteroides abscessus subsp. massiliense]